MMIGKMTGEMKKTLRSRETKNVKISEFRNIPMLKIGMM